MTRPVYLSHRPRLGWPRPWFILQCLYYGNWRGRVVDIVISHEQGRGNMDGMIHLANAILRVINGELMAKFQPPANEYSDALKRNLLTLERLAKETI